MYSSSPTYSHWKSSGNWEVRSRQEEMRSVSMVICRTNITPRTAQSLNVAEMGAEVMFWPCSENWKPRPLLFITAIASITQNYTPNVFCCSSLQLYQSHRITHQTSSVVHHYKRIHLAENIHKTSTDFYHFVYMHYTEITHRMPSVVLHQRHLSTHSTSSVGHHWYCIHHTETIRIPIKA